MPPYWRGGGAAGEAGQGGREGLLMCNVSPRNTAVKGESRPRGRLLLYPLLHKMRRGNGKIRKEAGKKPGKIRERNGKEAGN